MYFRPQTDKTNSKNRGHRPHYGSCKFHELVESNLLTFTTNYSVTHDDSLTSLYNRIKYYPLNILDYDISRRIRSRTPHLSRLKVKNQLPEPLIKRHDTKRKKSLFNTSEDGGHFFFYFLKDQNFRT